MNIEESTAFLDSARDFYTERIADPNSEYDDHTIRVYAVEVAANLSDKWGIEQITPEMVAGMSMGTLATFSMSMTLDEIDGELMRRASSLMTAIFGYTYDHYDELVKEAQAKIKSGEIVSNKQFKEKMEEQERQRAAALLIKVLEQAREEERDARESAKGPSNS